MDIQCFFCSSRRRHTRCALVTGVQTCALPISGEQYRASITLPDGTAKEVALPAAREAGIVLWAYPNRDDETLLLRIMAGPASYGKANLLLHHGDRKSVV